MAVRRSTQIVHDVLNFLSPRPCVTGVHEPSALKLGTPLVNTQKRNFCALWGVENNLFSIIFRGGVVFKSCAHVATYVRLQPTGQL